MNQSSNIVNKEPQRRRRISSTSIDENVHSMTNALLLSLQSYVDDIPFQFNPKYRTIIVPNIDIPEYDTSQIRDILARPIDLTLENKVLLGALEDLQRKKKEFQINPLHQQLSTNCQLSDSTSISTNDLPKNNRFSVNHFPSTVVVPSLTVSSSHPHFSPSNVEIPVNSSSIPLRSVSPSPSPSSFRVPSVRDIYWPSGNQEQYSIPGTCTSNIFNLPTPMNSSQSSPNLVKQPNRSLNNSNSIYINDLTATFDGTLTCDDPFNDAELRSLNDVVELNHLYSAIGSANTIRR